MHLAHKNFTKVIYLLVFLAATIFITLLPSPTHATVQAQQLPISINAQTIQVNSDNSLSLFHCVLSTQRISKYAFASYDLSNFTNLLINPEQVGNTTYLKYPYINACADSGSGKGFALSDSGELYGAFITRHISGKPDWKIGLQRNGSLTWEQGFKYCGQQDHDGQPISLTQGYDGHIYALIMNACDSNNHRFVSVDGQNGTIRFDTPLITQGMSAFGNNGHKVFAYNQGIVVLDGNTLRYFNYTGQEVDEKRHTIDLLNDREIAGITVTPDGTSYVHFSTSGTHNPCKSGGQGYDELYFRLLNGSDGYFSVPTCTHASINKLAPDPQGGIIISSVSRNNKNYILRYDENQTLRNSSTLSAGSGYQVKNYSSSPRTDIFGNIIFMQQVKRVNGDLDNHVIVNRIHPNGDIEELFSSKYEDVPGQHQSFFGVTFHAGLTNDKVLFSLCTDECNHTNTPYLYEVTASGVGDDYPRNLIGTAIPGHDIDNDGDGLTKWQEIQQGTADDNVDSDGDGLDDFLESRWNPNRHDLFCNNDRSVCEYPNPSEKDIYVEVDWMTRPAENGVDSYTTKPSGDQMDEIKEAFADKGIHAHFDTGQLGGGNEVPYNHVVKFGVIPNEIDFYDYKKGGDGISANFNPNRYQIYHYMLSGYRFNEPPAPASSGVALVSDDDFFVSFGALKEDFGFVWPGSSEKAITGTIIHELGHNLCLTSNTHNDPACSFEGIDANYGNSYPSAMNYDRQFELIDYSTGENGSGDHDDWNALRLNDFASSNIGDEAHDLLQSMQQQTMRMRSPLHLQPQYREFQNKLREFDRSVERHE